MKTLYSYTILILLLVSCKKETITPKVKYDKVQNEVKVDTSKVGIADLPIHFEGSEVLVFPIGELTVGTMKKGSYESIKSNDDNLPNFKVSNSMENEITGYIRNIKFQVIGQDSLHALTDKLVLIENITFIKSKKAFVYTLSDKDTNQDATIDLNDIKVLYVSDAFGTNFIKISPDLHEVIDWKYEEATNKIFFRTLDDANKNGQLDKADRVHYFYFGFKDKQAVEYKIM